MRIKEKEEDTMFRLFFVSKLLFILVLIFFFAGCNSKYFNREETKTADLSKIEAEEFPQEIKRLQSVAKGHKDSKARRTAHIRLAWLYSSCRNPKQDYPRAYKELKKYVSLNPDAENSYTIQNWLAALKELERLSNLLEKLAHENKELTETIEKLESLDLKLEEKRKSYK